MLSKGDILHLAKLANLTLTEAEIEKFQNQFTETIKYVENLKELDTSNVSTTSSSANLSNIFFEDGKPCTRMFTSEQATANAEEKKNECFIVKRIME